MKIKDFFTSAAFLLLATGIAAANESPVTSITTNAGKTYKNVRVFQVDPDGVMFSHQNGGAKVLFGELPIDIQTKLGYSADKEAAYKKEHAEKIREERRQAVELQKEQYRADAAAAAVQLEIVRQQAYAESYAAGGGYGPIVTPPFWDAGIVPTLGYGYGYGYGQGSSFSPGYGGYHHHRDRSGAVIAPGGYQGGPVNIRTTGYRRGPSASRAVPLGIPALGNPAPALAPRSSGGGGARVSVSSR